MSSVFSCFNSSQDKQVTELAQELTVLLGLKTRKPYVSAKVSKMTVLHLCFIVE